MYSAIIAHFHLLDLFREKKNQHYYSMLTLQCLGRVSEGHAIPSAAGLLPPPLPSIFCWSMHKKALGPTCDSDCRSLAICVLWPLLWSCSETICFSFSFSIAMLLNADFKRECTEQGEKQGTNSNCSRTNTQAVNFWALARRCRDIFQKD